MKLETITRLQAAGFPPEQYQERGAAMRLAWRRVANAHWTARDFGAVRRDLFAQYLKEAHAQVKMARQNAAKREAGNKDPRVVALREQRDMLENKSFNVSIRAEQDRINREINAIINAQEA